MSPQWFKAATLPGRPELEYGKLAPDYTLGYGYNWWLRPNGTFLAEGAFGQFIYIAPASNVVVVQMSHWPQELGGSNGEDLESEMYSFYDAVANELK